jgi:hypothetical protein
MIQLSLDIYHGIKYNHKSFASIGYLHSLLGNPSDQYSKLSLKLVYILWAFIAAEKDQFLLLFLVVAILSINR